METLKVKEKAVELISASNLDYKEDLLEFVEEMYKGVDPVDPTKFTEIDLAYILLLLPRLLLELNQKVGPPTTKREELIYDIICSLVVNGEGFK